MLTNGGKPNFFFFFGIAKRGQLAFLVFVFGIGPVRRELSFLELFCDDKVVCAWDMLHCLKLVTERH